MRSGNLDRRITIQRKNSIQNQYGEPIETWIDVATVWAEKRDLRGTERYAAQQDIAEVDTRFRLWYRRGFSAMDRILCEGRTYEIVQVIELGRREGLDVMAKGRAE